MAEKVRYSPGAAPRDFREAIEALGAARLAELFGVHKNQIWVMKQRRSIASQYWRIIADEARAKKIPGLSLADLQRMKLERFPNSLKKTQGLRG